MNKVNKSVSILLSILMVISLVTAVPFTAGAAETNKVSTSVTFETCGDYEYYVLEDGTAIIIDYNGSATELKIPGLLDGHTVTSIGRYAFDDCTSLTSVTIGHTVTSIWRYAFEDCTSLTSVTIGNGVTSIGLEAFYGCTSLTSVTIGNGVTSIGDYAFEDCTSLTSITIPDSVTSIGVGAFYCTGYYYEESNWENGVLYIGDNLIEAKDTVSGEYKIKDGTRVIADSAFADCTSLTSVTIPNSVTSIEGAFSECTSLTRVTIGNGVKSIGDWAFENCTNLTSVTIPDSVTSIGYQAFYECTSLTSVTIPDSVRSIGDYAFYYCESLTSVTIGKGVTSIGTDAFCDTGYYYNSSNWENGDYGDYVLYIGDYLINVNAVSDKYKIKVGTKVIADDAFYNCTSLTSITIPDSVTSIGDEAFENCTGLTSVTIGKGVRNIGASAFEDCTSLKGVTIPDSVTNIGEIAFGYYWYYYDEYEYDYVEDLYHSGYDAQISGFTITGYKGTEAEIYAKSNGFKFISLGEVPSESDATSPTEPVPTPTKPAKTKITLKKSSGSVYVKGTTNIKATVKNGKGTTTYKSSNSKVAKVSKSGKVTGLKKGTARITVANNGVKKTFKITVKNPKLSKKTVSVKKGKTTKVKIYGKIKGVNNKYINTKLAKVTSKKSASTLTIKGLRKGKTTLKIIVSGVTLKLKVKVK